MVAMSLDTPAHRDELVRRLMAEENVVMLGCGVDSIRFRPPLTVTTDDLRLAVQAIDRVLTRMEG
jgi:L-lysine 6-transaminase